MIGLGWLLGVEEINFSVSFPGSEAWVLDEEDGYAGGIQETRLDA